MSRNEPINRRTLLLMSAAALVLDCLDLQASEREDVSKQLGAIQARIGGRLGVHALDTQSGRRIGLDDSSRYAMASTFKLLLAACILSQVDSRKLSLTTAVVFGEKDMLPNSPVTSKALSKGSLMIEELCAAVVEVSDNAAANLLLRRIGGPEGLTQFVRTLGDTETRMDRCELELNSNLAGDRRDTTTPRAMVESMEHVLVGDMLSKPSRERLTQWMMQSSTGLQRLRAGLPAGWRAGDKTGTGQNGAINDVAIVWPPNRKPILMAVYMSESKQKTDMLNAAHAESAKIVAGALAT